MEDTSKFGANSQTIKKILAKKIKDKIKKLFQNQ